MTSGSDYVEQFARAYQFANEYPLGANSTHPIIYNSTCNNFKEADYLQQMQDPNPENADRSWYWQSCVEFGYFQGSYPPQSVFSFSRS